MDSDVYINLVKQKINFLLKDDLYNFALNNKLISKGKYTKGDIIQSIKKNLDNDLALKIISCFKSSIGYTATETEQLLKITKSERLQLAKKGIITCTGTYEVRAYGKYLDCPIYDPVKITNIIADGVEGLQKYITKATEKQLAALEKARITSVKNRTCKNCGNVMNRKKDLNNDGICYRCEDMLFRESQKQYALQRRKHWLENKDKYLILDLETTGLCYDDEIIEIGIIDLDGNIIMNQLVKPKKVIPLEAIEIHGITNEMVQDQPSWSELYSRVEGILQDKIIIAYNAEFDIGMIKSTSRKYCIKGIELKYECLMENTMLVCGTDRWIKLQDAIWSEGIHIGQDHRAIGDCRLCLELIKINQCGKEHSKNANKN